MQPPCVDGHTDDGGECPEWVCADCGTALVIGDAVPRGTAAVALQRPRRRLRRLGVPWESGGAARLSRP